ncbi:MAG: NAD(P)-dependent alcohol dehydrogenase [Thaumarchaeota archaeon]|nr:NAD(P)-dependent alcohol dehydrogenase [Nitrososphaerota archaeon]MDE1839692.1 NAD(P)-dependent alcohol dehydrogenase [Nitrososphaerota archaeon]
MKAARLHQYNHPLQIDEVDLPKPKGEGVLVKVSGAGVCHSDIHFMKGEWKDALPVKLPLTVGHETAGYVEEMGESVQGFSKGDAVAVFGGWGCGICQACKGGDEQLCSMPRWPGLSQNDGGYAEYIHVPSYRFLVKVDGLDPKNIAPLTDAGLTPYRAVKKVRHLLNPNTYTLLFGVGGLGCYAIQYLKLFSPTNVIAVVRSEDKANLAKKMGSDFVINSRTNNVIAEVKKITSNQGIDVAIDVVSSNETLTTGMSCLRKKGTMVIVGLMGNSFNLPIMESVLNEFRVIGSLWGNYNELTEVLSLAKMNKLQIPVNHYKLSDVGKAIENLESGKICGRAVLIP